MNPRETYLANILRNNAGEDKLSIKHILIVYDREEAYIGDTCIHVSRLRKIRAYFPNASITAATSSEKQYRMVRAVLDGNPNVDHYRNASWEQIEFEQYDLIICGCVPEQPFVDYFLARYGQEIVNGSFDKLLYTASEIIGFDEYQNKEPFLPKHRELIDFRLSPEDEQSMLANELHVSEEERKWADGWLTDSGLGRADDLMIFIDNSSSRDKLMKITDYFDILTACARRPGTKILIFDEQKLGKKRFYREWLETDLHEKLLFAEGLSLRQAIALISSGRTRLVFGPSTGLLHCASGAFNILLQKKLLARIPVMVAYLGSDPRSSFREDRWWGGSYVDAILPVRKQNNGVEIISIKNVDYEKLKSEGRILGCDAYSAESLLEYIRSRFSREASGLQYYAADQQPGS